MEAARKPRYDQRLVRCPICDGTGKLVRRYWSDPCRHCDRGEGDDWVRDPKNDNPKITIPLAFTNRRTGVTVWSRAKTFTPNVEARNPG